MWGPWEEKAESNPPIYALPSGAPLPHAPRPGNRPMVDLKLQTTTRLRAAFIVRLSCGDDDQDLFKL